MTCPMLASLYSERATKEGRNFNQRGWNILKNYFCKSRFVDMELFLLYYLYIK